MSILSKNSTSNKFLVFFIVSLLIACTPKTTEKVVEVTKPADPVLSAEDKLCRTFAQLGSQQEEALTAFVLYKDRVKTKEFDVAYPLWQKAFQLAPKSDGKKTYHYDDGVKIFTHFYKQATSEIEKRMWVDSVKYLYDRRERCFGEGDYLAARQGFDMYYSFKDHVELDYIYNLFKRSSDGLGDKIPYFAINPFSKIILDQMGAEAIGNAEGAKYAMNLLSAINYGNANCGDKCETWEIINSYAPDRLESLEAFKDFYPCSYYKEKYYPEFLANPTDCEIIEKVGIRLRRGGCSGEGAELIALTEAFRANCKVEVIKDKGPLREAYDCYRSGDYNCATAKFDEYLATETDPEKLAKTNLTVAKIYYRDIKNFPKSRSYALEAAKNKSAWGDPYILIGKLYASSGPKCGPGTGWDSQVVTWPAIDKWQYAKSIDSSVADEANSLIRTYQKYMPSLEDVFSRPNVKEGGPFYVPCWIKENTTVRIAK